MHAHRLCRPLLALTLAVLFAPQAGAAAQASDPAAAARAPRGEYERIVERVREQTRGAIEQAEQAVREAEREHQVLIERNGELLAQLDTDLEWPTLAFIDRELGATREIVKNAPYTADAVSESIQLLQDGNRIVKRSVTRLARDTYGRTRQEKEAPRGATVYIFDPIDHRNYALNPQRRSAVRIPRVPDAPVPPLAPDLEGAPLAFAPPAPPAPPTPPTPAVAPAPPVSVTPPTPPTPPAPVLRAPAAPRAPAEDASTERVIVRRGDDASSRDDVRVEVIRIGGRDATALAQVTPMPSIAMPLVPRGKGERKSLGTRDFDGVKAEGTQTTHTIPAGEIGNEKPIVITSERWFSPELQLVVFARTRDPRAGETTYRLTNLRKGEPPAELFRVPADYRTRDPRG